MRVSPRAIDDSNSAILVNDLFATDFFRNLQGLPIQRIFDDMHLG